MEVQSVVHTGTLRGLSNRDPDVVLDVRVIRSVPLPLSRSYRVRLGPQTYLPDL